MIFDQQTLFSDRQSIASSAPSDRVVDLGKTDGGLTRDVGQGVQIPLAIQVVEAFTASGAATLTVDLQVDDNASFSSPKTVATSGPIGKADLIPGRLINLGGVARGSNERYMRLNYTVASGPMTSGALISGIVAGLYSFG